MAPIPRGHEDWESIVPNETDQKLAHAWRFQNSPDFKADWLAAASRLHEQERGVAALAVHLFDGSESMSYFVSEARRILGCEPESGEKGGSNG